MAKKNEVSNTKFSGYPPVVTVLGHVDHGKTTLLDAIRKTNIAQKESGGITQKIGASTIETIHEGVGRKITFIDTPGHEAFMKMRSRGAQACDMAFLVVSATDGVMPQTKESIQLLKSANLSFIVVITKADLPDKNIEKVKQQLLKEEVLLEGLGGDVPVIEVSAKTGKNIKELLDLSLLVFDMIKSSETSSATSANEFKGVVIESRLDPKVGPRATIVVKSGIVNVRDEIISDTIEGRARTIVTDKGKHINQATIGDAVEILGFNSLPAVGSLVTKKLDQKEEKVSSVQQEVPEAIPFTAYSQDKHSLAIILCSDTLGSLEAIVHSLPSSVKILEQKTGEISQADVLLAKSTNALVLGFNAIIRPDVMQLATVEKVLLKNYTIIYELIQEVKDVLEGKRLALEEKVFGKAKIKASFPFEKTTVLGVVVVEGRIARGDKVRIMKDENIVGETTISSLRQGKNSISKVEKGQEAGVLISPFIDFTIGDMLLCHG